MIKGISRLDFECNCCTARADFRVDRPGTFSPLGTRGEYFCRAHMPADARASWQGEESVEPGASLVKKYDFEEKAQ